MEWNWRSFARRHLHFNVKPVETALGATLLCALLVGSHILDESIDRLWNGANSGKLYKDIPRVGQPRRGSYGGGPGKGRGM